MTSERDTALHEVKKVDPAAFIWNIGFCYNAELAKITEPTSENSSKRSRKGAWHVPGIARTVPGIARILSIVRNDTKETKEIDYVLSERTPTSCESRSAVME